jgi:hypothetical protein
MPGAPVTIGATWGSTRHRSHISAPNLALHALSERVVYHFFEGWNQNIAEDMFENAAGVVSDEHFTDSPAQRLLPKDNATLGDWLDYLFFGILGLRDRWCAGFTPVSWKIVHGYL